MINILNNVPHHIPLIVGGSIKIFLIISFFFVCLSALLGSNCNNFQPHFQMTSVLCWQNKTLFVSQSVSFHMYSVIHLPKIGSSQGVMEIYLCCGWLWVVLGQAVCVVLPSKINLLPAQQSKILITAMFVNKIH